MFKYLHNESIISLGRLCGDGCTAITDKQRIHVVKVTHLVLSGKENQMDGLWDTPLTAPVLSPWAIKYVQSENIIIRKKIQKITFSLYSCQLF